MTIYTFYSVHEQLLAGICRHLRANHGVSHFSGFVWGKQQARSLSEAGIEHSRLNVYTKDLLPALRQCGAPDVSYLEHCEAAYGTSINRMVFSERHLLKGLSFPESLRLVELVFRLVEDSYRTNQPSLVLSTDVACLVSYVHCIVAKGMDIPYCILGDARLPLKRVMIYHNAFQMWEQTDKVLAELLDHPLTPSERSEADAFVEKFKEQKARPPGSEKVMRLPGVEKRDFSIFLSAIQSYREDPANPTVFSIGQVLKQRIRRWYRNASARAAKVFEPIDPSEKYVLFPLHFQPEASTLVLAPYYLDQIALIEDIAKSLPVGYRLYVKEHGASIGRRPKEYYDRIRAIYGVRLLASEENSWALLQGAAAPAVITGTMGWEALLFERPVITFGEVFYNSCPLVYRAGSVPKERWYDLFSQAIFNHKPDREVLLKYVTAILRTSYNGYWRSASTVPEVLDDANLAELANAIAAGSGVFAPRGYVAAGTSGKN